MVSLGHGALSFNGSMPERSQSSSAYYGKNALNKKLGQKLKKKRWEVKINLSQYTPRKIEETLIIPEVRTSTRKITLENISLEVDVILVMKQDTLQKIVLKEKIRKRETGEDIMVILQRMMNLPQIESDKKVMILQVMKNMS